MVAGRPERLRAVGAGLADQVVIATANAGNSLLAAALFPPHRAGVLILSIIVGYVLLSLNRAFVGEVLLALAARFTGEQRDRLVRDGLAAALTAGIAGSGLLCVGWLGGGDLPDLGWVALVLPVVLLHDTARLSYLADRRADRALVVDVMFVAVQGATVLTLVGLDLMTPGRLVLCWGAGALAGFVVFVGRTGHGPWRGDPRRWLAQTRYLTGWFTATAVVAQMQVLAIHFTIGALLSKSAVAGFRVAQTVVLQPVQNFNQAVMSMLIPRLSGLADGAKSDDAAAAALRRQVLRNAALLGGLAAAMIAVGGLLTQWLLPMWPKYADTAPLGWPLLVQGGLYMVQAPFTAAVRGMHRARTQFVQYVVFTTASLVGLVVGAATGGMLGATWGLTFGSAVGLATTIALYFHALRRLGSTERLAAAEA